MNISASLRRTAVTATAILVLAGCSSGTRSAAPTTTRASSQIVAMVASYEPLARTPQRFLVGVLRSDKNKLVSFGHAQLRFTYEGTKAKPISSPRPAATVTADWVPIPGQHLANIPDAPRFADGSDGTGVYRADPVTFDQPGFWRVDVAVTLDGHAATADAAFEVFANHRIPNVGDPAPRTQNPIAGAPGVAPRAIDSRADATTPIPDGELHSTSVAAAIAAHRPLMVVVSTPTYCQSRFCGPITDSVEALAKQHSTRMAFVHLEVWKDFEHDQLSPYAEEWIDPDHSGGNEPWVFVVGSDGLIKQRFDNVATDDELATAVKTFEVPGG